MSKLFLGKELIGNFDISPDVDDITNGFIERQQDVLVLNINGQTHKLSPTSQESNLVIEEFDDSPRETNSSIYRMELNKGQLVIVLYSYRETIKFTHIGEEINLYVIRSLENELFTEPRFEKLDLNYKKDIPEFLRNEFFFDNEETHNNSIFVDIVQKDKENSFNIVGRHYYARARKEREGMFSISTISPRRKEQIDHLHTQLYGKINFVTFEDSISIPSSVVTFKPVNTSSVFKAWDEYMDFEKELFNESREDSHIFKYNSFKIVGESVVFSIDHKTCQYLEEAQDNEYEFIPFNDEDSSDIHGFDDINLYKNSHRWNVIYLDKCINESFDSPVLKFKYNSHIDPSWGSFGGLIYISSFSLDIEQRRRKAVKNQIESKKNATANIIMRLSDTNVVDTTLGGERNPITDKTMIKMFGKPVELKDNYKKAMYIALNTPDIALIQGPPGSGKTTLIRGLVARLNEIGKNVKILVSSEQHEALYNVVDQLSKNRLIPPFVSSRRKNSDTSEEDIERMTKNVRTFQESFIKLCDDILRENGKKDSFSTNISELVYLFSSIKDDNYSINSIRLNFEKISEKLSDMGILSNVDKEFTDLNAYLFRESSKSNESSDSIQNKMLERKIESQRLSIEQYFDDGEYQLNELQRRLESLGYKRDLLDSKILEAMNSQDESRIKEAFPKYVSYVNSIKNKFIKIEYAYSFEKEEFNLKQAVDNLYSKIMEVIQNQPKQFDDIVEELKFRLCDYDSALEIVKTYTSVVGSTCAQAGSSGKYVNLTNDKYDYVIIDEAARANPLDIMIPMMIGKTVILIGDQNQLPHYIETSVNKKFEEKNNRYSKYDMNLLKKSLFEILYDNLDKAWEDGRLKFQRTIRVQEQHRMHPTIGDFISNEFYVKRGENNEPLLDKDGNPIGAIANGVKTIGNINDYHVYDGKNIAWIDVPTREGLEQKYDASKVRPVEVEKVISVLKKIIKNNEGRSLNIGIITFYSGQVDLINESIKQTFPDSYYKKDEDSNITISCNTVDSYQGKEFDIVILSGVRANSEIESSKALGFIDYSKSRINVALSRAKRLLIVVADSKTFRKNKYFDDFYKYVKEKGYYE